MAVNSPALEIRLYCVMKSSLSGFVGMGHLVFLRGCQHTKGTDLKPRISPYLFLLRQYSGMGLFSHVMNDEREWPYVASGEI